MSYKRRNKLFPSCVGSCYNMEISMYCSLPFCAQYTLAEGILRQRGGSCCHKNESRS